MTRHVLAAFTAFLLAGGATARPAPDHAADRRFATYANPVDLP